MTNGPAKSLPAADASSDAADRAWLDERLLSIKQTLDGSPPLVRIILNAALLAEIDPPEAIASLELAIKYMRARAQEARLDAEAKAETLVRGEDGTLYRRCATCTRLMTVDLVTGGSRNAAAFRSDVRFCSDACRQRAYRARRSARPDRQPATPASTQ